MRRFGIVIPLIVGAAIALAGCGNNSDMLDNELLRQSVEKIAESECSDYTAAELREAASLIVTATDKEKQHIFERNPSLKSVDDLDKLNVAFVEKANACEGAATAAPDDCPAEFVQVAIDRTETTQVDPRYGQRVTEIRAQNLSPDEFKSAIDELELELAGTNAQTLAAIAASAGLYDPSSDWRELVEGGVVVDGGCLTQKGQELYAMLKGAITATGTEVEVVEAPQNMTNSGIRNGDTFVVATIPGVAGPTEAVKYTFINGTVVYHVVVCMNPLWLTPPAGIPTEVNITPPQTNPTTNPPTTGPTDNAPPTTSSSTSTTPPTTKVKTCVSEYGIGFTGTYPVCKDPAVNDSAAQNNAPTGGGVNADSGPGTVTVPTQPPVATYVAPPPAPAPTDPPVGSTPDPAPAPAPEPEAPEPTAPATGSVCPPGITTGC